MLSVPTMLKWGKTIQNGDKLPAITTCQECRWKADGDIWRFNAVWQ